MTERPVFITGIDLGGTKIETRLFDENFETLKTLRRPTPRDYEDLKTAVIETIAYGLDVTDQDRALGISLPGFYHKKSGRLTANNLAVGNHPLINEIETYFGRGFFWENDCKCFAYSEAHGGAAAGAGNVIGLIIGTGLAAGWIATGQILPSQNGAAVEIGHIGVPADLVERHALPLFPCVCGRQGCWEATVSGTGVENLAAHILGKKMAMPELLEQRRNGDEQADLLFEIWLDLVSHLMMNFMLSHDPEVIVLGGGLSLIDDLPRALQSRLDKLKFPDFEAPNIVKAKFGDSSGVRGAALLAHHAQRVQSAPKREAHHAP